MHPGIIHRTSNNLVRDHFSFGFHFIIATSHKSLDREHSIFRVNHSLPFCGLPNQTFTIFVEGDHRRAKA